MLLLCSIFLVSSLPVYAQEEIEEPAEIVATIDVSDNIIPPIGVSEWTTINLTVLDAYGIPWAYLSSKLPILARYIWPIIHPSWKPFLGYSSLRFEPEIIEGDSRGWYTRVTPSAIPNADQNKTYPLKLEVKTDDIAVDYAVVVGIKVTRVNVFGDDAGVSYIYIPVKASSLNNIKMETQVSTKETAPHSFVHFDIIVRNLGYYRDMFSLEFIEENGLEVATSKQLFVLNPGESQDIRIDVLTSERLFDLGTPNKIEIYAVSSGDSNSIHIGTIVVITKGVFISPLIGIIATPIIVVLIILCILFYNIKNKRDQELFGKPTKPWTLPEEKKYLEKLKEKNKEEYDKVLQMMKDEYQSALLWFEDYRNSMKSGEKGRKQKESLGTKFTNFFKGSNEKSEEDKSVEKEEKIIEETKDIEKASKVEPPKKTADQRLKEKALLKIKREQKKQKLKTR
jgi:hypothetical protein